MIRKVKFNNFYSFNEEQEINFLAQKKESYDYYNSEAGDQVTKIAGFIGGNASGKTNVMRLLGFLQYFICYSVYPNNSAEPTIAYQTFFNNTRQTKIYIEFETESKIFFYDIKIQENTVIEESLKFKKITKNSKIINLFNREGSLVENLSKKYFKAFPQKSLELMKPNASLLSFLSFNYNISIINDVDQYFKRFKTNINEKGEINIPVHQYKILELYLNDPELKKKMEDIIRNFDIGLNNFDIEKKPFDQGNDKGFKITINGIHNTKEKNNRLDMLYESRGTRSLFFTLANILSGLKNNSVIILDEIETGFHPEALKKIINYFTDENEMSRAQLIFSSHYFGFMSKFDMHQIYLVDKNEVSESSVHRLNKVEGIRSDENFLSKYMTGAYGAFPNITI